MVRVEEITLKGQRTDERSSLFPLVLSADHSSLDDGLKWIQQNAETLTRRSSVHGAVLFRGFGLQSDVDFDRFVMAFGLPNFRYRDSLSNAVRTNRTERVFTANEAPSAVEIRLHHEMAQTPVFPSRLFFFCEQAAVSGGATPLCRSDVLFARIQKAMPEFADQCREKGLLYSHVMPADNDAGSGMGRSWKSTWNAETRNEAESRMTSLGYRWQWLDGDCLKVTTPTLPAVKVLDDGREVFFNQLIAAFAGWKDARNDPSKSITFGDGGALPTESIHRVIEMAEELSFDVAWQTGDVALVDNYVAMHGRRPFEGTRRVLASLVAS